MGERKWFLPPAKEGWKAISTFNRPDLQSVDVWMHVHASLRSFGMADAFEVPSAWRENGTWFHTYVGRPTELYGDYITHWRAARATAPNPSRED